MPKAGAPKSSAMNESFSFVHQGSKFTSSYEDWSEAEDRASIFVSLVQAKSLPVGGGRQPDSYASISLGSHSIVLRTISNCDAPRWDENFAFPIESRADRLVIKVFHQKDDNDRDVLLGQVMVPVLEYPQGELFDEWLTIFQPGQQRSSASNGKSSSSLTTVLPRIRVRFQVRATFSTHFFGAQGLPDKLNSFARRLARADLVLPRLLLQYMARAEIVSTKQGDKLLRSLLVVVRRHSFRLTRRLLEWCISEECQRAHAAGASNMFRNNNIAPKLLSIYSGEVGGAYIVGVLRPLVGDVVSEVSQAPAGKNIYEVDKNRLSGATSDLELKARRNRLLRKTQQLLDRIVSKEVPLPQELQAVASAMKRIVTSLFPRPASALSGESLEPHAPLHNSLASYYFLRFLCPAIVTPGRHGVSRDGEPGAAPRRALMLVAKLLQTLANSAGGESSALTAVGRKEPFMADLASEFVSQNREKMIEFLEGVSSTDRVPWSVLPSFAPAQLQDDEAYSSAVVDLHTFMHARWDKIAGLVRGDEAGVDASNKGGLSVPRPLQDKQDRNSTPSSFDPEAFLAAASAEILAFVPGTAPALKAHHTRAASTGAIDLAAAAAALQLSHASAVSSSSVSGKEQRQEPKKRTLRERIFDKGGGKSGATPTPASASAAVASASTYAQPGAPGAAAGRGGFVAMGEQAMVDRLEELEMLRFHTMNVQLRLSEQLEQQTAEATRLAALLMKKEFENARLTTENEELRTLVAKLQGRKTSVMPSPSAATVHSPRVNPRPTPRAILSVSSGGMSPLQTRSLHSSPQRSPRTPRATALSRLIGDTAAGSMPNLPVLAPVPDFQFKAAGAAISRVTVRQATVDGEARKQAAAAAASASRSNGGGSSSNGSTAAHSPGKPSGAVRIHSIRKSSGGGYDAAGQRGI